jgi:THO complex subunit 1
VNLRGEYHVENVTTFDVLPAKEATPEKMEVDSEPKDTKQTTNGTPRKAAEDTSNTAKGVTFSKAEKALSADELYPIFWALQQNFSQPKRLFDPANFAEFKAGLEATMAMFIKVQAETMGRPTKATEDSKRGTKRKRGQGDDDLANAFNPKYLTSRDLFELEVFGLSTTVDLFTANF